MSIILQGLNSTLLITQGYSAPTARPYVAQHSYLLRPEQSSSLIEPEQNSYPLAPQQRAHVVR